MSKKRTSTESDNDEQANERSGSLSQNENNAKRTRLDLPSDTTLQDLQIELLQSILIKAVVMEVKGLKLAKCAWEKKADPVISRLRSVCLQWSNVLTTDEFRTELHRTLDDTAQDTIRLEVLQELSVKPGIQAVAALNDEIFTVIKMRDRFYAIIVYDRDNMEVVKDVIKLPEAPDVTRMTACNASNCLYVGLEAESYMYRHLTVLRICKDAQHQFNMSKWRHVYERQVHMLSVTANGGLLTFTEADSDLLNPASVAVHDANDSLQLEVFLPRKFGTFGHVIQKSNGNLLLSSFDERDLRRSLLEIDTTGSVLRQYQLPTGGETCVNFADNNGRILLTECRKSQRMELLDSEFNLLGVYSLPHDVGKSVDIYDMKYDSERSVIMSSHYNGRSKKNVLTTFRFTEE